MAELTRTLARSQPVTQPVRLSDSLTAHVRRLPGEALGDFVAALQLPAEERSVHLTVLCACNADGTPLFEAKNEDTLAEARAWPPVWLLKLSDAAGQVNGLDVEDDTDPKPEPDASLPVLQSVSGAP